MDDIIWPKAEYAAIQALWRGSGDAGTNQRALRFIVEVLGKVNGQAFVAGAPDQTAFNEGRRWVARQVQNALTLPEKSIVEQEIVDDGSSRGSGTSGDGQRAAVRTAVDRIKRSQHAARKLIESGG